MRLSAQPWGHAAATGAGTPIRPKFEEDAREADGPGPRARHHFATARCCRKPRTADGTRPRKRPRSTGSRRPPSRRIGRNRSVPAPLTGSTACRSPSRRQSRTSTYRPPSRTCCRSSATAAIDASEGIPATAWRDSGASTSPTITAIASRRPMSRRRFITKHHTGPRTFGRRIASHVCQRRFRQAKAAEITWLSRRSPELNRARFARSKAVAGRGSPSGMHAERIGYLSRDGYLRRRRAIRPCSFRPATFADRHNQHALVGGVDRRLSGRDRLSSLILQLHAREFGDYRLGESDPYLRGRGRCRRSGGGLGRLQVRMGKRSGT